ncbi:ComE operon protein 1 [compost metagenome]
MQEIPGIGEKKAKAIVDYRNEHGPFKSVDELTNVKGIGEKMLEKMRPHIGL